MKKSIEEITEVTLEFRDGEIIKVKIPNHVYSMWLNCMKRSLAKFAKIIKVQNEKIN